MKFDTVLEYQKIDHDLLEIESEVAKSNKRAPFIGAKSTLHATTAAIDTRRFCPSESDCGCRARFCRVMQNCPRARMR